MTLPRIHLYKLVVMPHPRDSRSMLGIHHQMPNGMITGTARILELHLSVSLVVATCKMVRPCHNTIWERCVCFIRQLPAHYMTVDMSIGGPQWTLLRGSINSYCRYETYETCNVYAIVVYIYNPIRSQVLLTSTKATFATSLTVLQKPILHTKADTGLLMPSGLSPRNHRHPGPKSIHPWFLRQGTGSLHPRHHTGDIQHGLLSHDQVDHEEEK